MINFAVSKILQQFLIPTVFSFTLILIGIIFSFSKKKQKTRKILLYAGIALIYIFSITPISDLALKPLENNYSQIKEKNLSQADTIVLLLGGGDADVLRGSEALRIYHLADQKTKIIVSGTDPWNSGSETANATRNFFINRGVLAENIVIEGKSNNTRESAKNVKKLVESNPFFLVTSAYHMERSIQSFKKVGTNPIPAPADFKIKGSYNILDFFPNPDNLKKSDLAFHEYFGIIFYKIINIEYN